MAATVSIEPMTAAEGAVLAEFARACKSAARSVSLYPGTHPAIQGALSRVTAAAERITAQGDISIGVFPNQLVVDGRAPEKPDPSVGELAELLHSRLIGELTIRRDAAAPDWQALLLLLARTTEELRAEGGIAKVWTACGRASFEIREIDYAEVLRERTGPEGAAWQRIIEFCLQGDSRAPIDERALEAIAAALGNPERFRELLDALQSSAEGAVSIGDRIAALLTLIQKALDALSEQRGIDRDAALQTIADSAAHMTADTMLALLQQARETSDGGAPPLATEIVDRIGDQTVASFVAGSVASERGATERLALAFEMLVPDFEHKEQIIELARSAAQNTPFGQETSFDDLWKNAANMLTSYSDKSFVSEAYGRELSGTRTQAIEVERLSEDPPETIGAWLATVTESALQDLDVALIRDLLRIESDPAAWPAIAAVAAEELERRVQLGDMSTAELLVDAILSGRDEAERAGLGPAVETAIDSLVAGNITHYFVDHLRKMGDAGIASIKRSCQAIGPAIVHPLAVALAVEENHRAIRHIRDILLGFATAGRDSIEQLKNAANPAVRRTAVDLLRAFGGRDALPELASMLGDADPQVQREAIRALVQIGSDDAFAVLEQALAGGVASREKILQQLLGLREDRTIPLLCYVLNHTAPRGKLLPVHTQIIEALGSLSTHPESMRTLRGVLYRGCWWAPFRTATLRQASAAALHRLGSPEARAVLLEAVHHGSRGVRRAAQRYAAAAEPAG